MAQANSTGTLPTKNVALLMELVTRIKGRAQGLGTAEAHEHVRSDIEESDAKQLATTLNRDLVRLLVLFNRGERRRYPTLKIFRPDQEDISALVDNVVKLVPLGLKVEASVMRDKLGLPDPDEGAEVLQPPSLTVGSEWDMEEETMARAAASKKMPVSHQELKTPENLSPDPIEAFSAELLGDWTPLISPMTDPILELAAQCDNEKQFLERLPGLIAVQNVDSMTRQLARALYAAKLVGMVEGDGGPWS